MNKTNLIINEAKTSISDMVNHLFDVLEVSEPASVEAAVNLSKIISKLSPLVGNLIEFNIVDYLNEQEFYKNMGKWQRQDPGFPDAVFIGESVSPIPGIEVKAWFPLATEITARFKNSQTAFTDDNIYVAIIAWLPEYLIYGKPKIIDTVIISAADIAKSRDDHYNNPPHYIVIEPGDTSLRTVNLQQTNTNGYVFQGSAEELKKAEETVLNWSIENPKQYRPTTDYSNLLISLQQKYDYRLDTNYAKLNRIKNHNIDDFKNKVYDSYFHGMKICDWKKLLSSKNDNKLIEEFIKNGIIANNQDEEIVK